MRFRERMTLKAYFLRSNSFAFHRIPIVSNQWIKTLLRRKHVEEFSSVVDVVPELSFIKSKKLENKISRYKI